MRVKLKEIAVGHLLEELVVNNSQTAQDSEVSLFCTIPPMIDGLLGESFRN